MALSDQVTTVIIQQGVLPLYFNPDETVSIEVMKTLYKSGVKALEYTNRGEGAFNNFKKMIEVRNREMQELQLGIGTIKNIKEAERYLSVGADFLVSPGFVPEVARHALVNHIFYAPGCMTPSEIITAENAGINFIKLFPGNLLGPEFLSSIKEIFPQLLFMPTGGVDTTRESIEAWFKAGVCAVGMGSKLVSKKLMEQRDYQTIGTLTTQVLDLVKSVKGIFK